MGKLLLSAFLSLSLRTANIPDKPTDYEYKGGLESATIKISGYKERENGVVYDGFDYSQSEKHFYSKIKYKEAQSIDSQSFALIYPVNGWRFGAGLNAQEWNNGLPMIVMGYKNKFLVDVITKNKFSGVTSTSTYITIIDISYELASSRQIIDSKISEQIPLRGNFYLEPLASYHYEKLNNYTKDYWQAKLLIGYKFNIKK